MLKRVKKLCTHHHHHHKKNKKLTNNENDDKNNYASQERVCGSYNDIAASSTLSGKHAKEEIVSQLPSCDCKVKHKTKAHQPQSMVLTPSTTRTLSYRCNSMGHIPVTSYDNNNNNNKDDDDDNNNNDNNSKSNKNETSLRKRLFKKHFMKNSRSHSKQAKDSPLETPKTKYLSKSIGDLSERRHTYPACTPELSKKGLRRESPETSSRSSRSSASSLETLRENRRSAISQLDEYINHLKKTIDEENIACAPNRLCCAQLLRTVYLRREQQHHYESLHNPHAHRDRKHRPKIHSSKQSSLKENNSLPDFGRRISDEPTTSGSLQDINNTSFDSTINSPSAYRRVVFQHGTPPESETSSQYSSTGERDYSGFNSNSSGQNVDGFSLVRKDCNYNIDHGGVANCYIGYDSDDNFTEKTNDSGVSFGDNDDDSQKSRHRKSMPLFPQALDIDIY